MKIFSFLNYTILCVSLDTPTILYLQQNRSTSDGWNTHNLCEDIFKYCTPSVRKFVGNCTFPNLTNVMYVYIKHRPFEIWIRIRSSISLSIYQSSDLRIELCFTRMFMRHTRLFFPIISWFRRTSLKCTFVRDRRCDFSKRFHLDCVPPPKVIASHST